MTPKIVVFGSTGFVGSAVLERIQMQDVVAVGRKAPHLQGTYSPAADAKAIIAQHREVVSSLASKLRGVDVVVNAAGNPDASSRDWPALWLANAVLPAVVAAAAVEAGVGRLIHVSSAVVQGDRKRLDETEVRSPCTPYGRSKSMGEEWTLQVAPEIATIYRPGSVHAMSRRITRLLSRIGESMLSSVASPGTLPTPHVQLRNVADAIAFLSTATEKPPRVVIHPWEGTTTGQILEDLGGRAPTVLPQVLCSALVMVMKRAGRFHASMAANSRRLEVLWFGQSVGPSWLTQNGWQPPNDRSTWIRLGRDVREDRRRNDKSKRQRILFGVSTGMVAGSFFRGQFRSLKEAGWQVTLVSPDDGDARRTASGEGARFVALQARRDPSPLVDMITVIELLLTLLRVRPGVSVWGTPKVGILGTVLCKCLGIRSIYVIHGIRLETTKGAKRTLLLWLERAACACATVVVAVGNDVRRRAIMLRLVDVEKVRVLGNGSANGVLRGVFNPDARQRLCLPSHEMVFGFVGRITRDKGIVELLSAWQATRSILPGAVLLLAGHFEQDARSGRIQKLLTTSEGIRIVGYVEDLSDVYSSLDCLILPSYREGLPSVVLEAASYAVPSITSNATGVAEAVVDGETGIVVERGSVEQLKNAMVEMAASETRRVEMGQAAQQLALERYSRPVVHRAWLELFNELASHGSLH